MAETDESRNLRSEIESLKADLGKIRQDLHSISDTATHMGRDGAKYTRDALTSNLESWTNRVQDYMHKQPVSTVLIAFGAGLVVTRLLGRRR